MSYIVRSDGTIESTTPSGDDELVRVSDNDAIANYLSEKMAGGTGINLNVLNDGADEQLEIEATGGDASGVSYTPADNTDWNSDTDPGNVDDALDQLAARLNDTEAQLPQDAGVVTYTPGTAGNWNSSSDPGDVDNALDQLAARVKTLETTGGPSPDASAVTYTPAVNANWNSSSDPGDVDNALDQLAARVKTIETAPPDASIVTYSPSVVADWNSSSDPGDVDNALDQLAARTKDLEDDAGVANVKVSATDTTAGYLIDKLAAGSRVTLTKLNAASNEQVQIQPNIQDASVGTYTPGTLANWNSSTDPGEIDDALDQLASRVKTLETSGGPSPDASAVTYTPLDTGNWDGSADPGNVDDALDQLADRTTILEGHDLQVYASGTDATAGYLSSKIVAGDNISIAVIGTTDKKIEISSGGGSGDNESQDMVWLGMGVEGTVSAKSLARGILSNTLGAIYTAPADTTTRISSILMHNVDFEPHLVTLYLKENSSTSRMIDRFMIPAEGTYHFTPEMPFILEDEGELEAVCDAASYINYWVSGGERLTPVSGVITKHLYDGQFPNIETNVYTVPADTVTTVGSITMCCVVDPGGVAGEMVDIWLRRGTDDFKIYHACLHYLEVKHIYPRCTLEEGDHIRIMTEDSNMVDIWIDGAEVS